MNTVYYDNFKAYQEYLPSVPWDCFCSYTTDYALTSNCARNLMERYKSRLSTKIFNNERFLIFWVAEKFKSIDGFHLHALIQYPKDFVLDVKSDMNDAFQVVSAARKQGKYFRTDIQDYKPELLGAKYLAKDLYLSTTAYDLFIGG